MPRTRRRWRAPNVNLRVLSPWRRSNECTYTSKQNSCCFDQRSRPEREAANERRLIPGRCCAVDVLNDAFPDKVSDGEDVEDLMELAIKKANSAIHQMTAEHPRVSMMATTVVALHLDGARATIGHVGDSRLYRLSPEGALLRETEDHSIVEEEVRAGRMTPEQAANHPSKNVISRALGAEESVEVDMKTIEVEEGTSFLLCSDGITRHIPDNELRQILLTHSDLEAA